jgi:hypothetical protein
MSPDCFTPYDWSRSYLLPDHVISNIPRRGSVGMLGAHNVARGLLVETCRYLTGSVPLALHYQEREEPGDDVVLTMTATVRRRTAALLAVETCIRHRRWADLRVGDWSLRIDGVYRPDEDRAWPPSPPQPPDRHLDRSARGLPTGRVLQRPRRERHHQPRQGPGPPSCLDKRSCRRYASRATGTPVPLASASHRATAPGPARQPA